jgi:hypothetical protein
MTRFPRHLAILASLAIALVPADRVEAAEAPCIAVDQIATVFHYEVDAVALTELKDERECRFSVNFAPAGSPPRELVFAGLRRIFDGTMDELPSGEAPEPHPLAYVLLAAAPQSLFE